MSIETMSVSQLIEKLTALQNSYGDLPVVLSSDSEGNSFGTLNKTTIGYSPRYNKCGIILLMPYCDNIDYDNVDVEKDNE